MLGQTGWLQGGMGLDMVKFAHPSLLDCQASVRCKGLLQKEAARRRRFVTWRSGSLVLRASGNSLGNVGAVASGAGRFMRTASVWAAAPVSMPAQWWLIRCTSQRWVPQHLCTRAEVARWRW